MKQALAYWGLIAVLGIIHLQELILILAWNIPVYLTSVAVIGFVCYLSKRILLQISIFGVNWNSLFFLLQLLLVLTHSISGHTFLPLFLFLGIESFRLYFSKQLSSYEQRLKQYEEQSAHINETFRIVRSERHDFLKHISAIHFLLEKGKSDEAKSYLDGLVDGYEETNLSIKGEKGVVAGILNQMYRRAKASGISVAYDLDLPLSTLPLSDHDIVTLLSNLLSNSLDACEDWQKKHNEQGMISLQFYKRGGLYLLTCANNSLPIPSQVLDGLFHTYGKTTKANGHEGLGTKMIHDIIKDYQGFLDFVYKEEEFQVKIKVPAIQ